MMSRDPNFVRILQKSKVVIIENNSSPFWIIDRASSIFKLVADNYGIVVSSNSSVRGKEGIKL